MKAIKFSESELEFLQNHYELELSDAENYVVEIKNILKKLGVSDTEITKEKPAKSTGKKRGRPKKEKNINDEVATPAPAKPVKKVNLKRAEKKGKIVKTVKATPKSASKVAKSVPAIAAVPEETAKPE